MTPETQKILLAFEYGIILSDTAKGMNIELTKEMVVKAEEMMTSEFESRTIEQLASDMQVNVLSCLGTDMTATDTKKAP